MYTPKADETIKVTNLRTRGNEPPFDPMIQHKTPHKACEDFLLYEVAYGGMVNDLSDTKVSIVTWVMNCKDTSILEGTKENMEDLVALAVAAVMVQKETRQPSDALMDKIMTVTGGNPLMLKLGAGMLIGGDRVRRIILQGMGLTPEEAGKWSDLRITNKEMLTALMWHKQGDCSLEDAFNLCKDSQYEKPKKTHRHGSAVDLKAMSMR